MGADGVCAAGLFFVCGGSRRRQFRPALRHTRVPAPSRVPVRRASVLRGENTAGYSICAAAVNEDFTAGYVNALGNNTNIEQVYNDGQGDGEGHWFINAEGQLERRGDINADAGTGAPL